MNRYTIFADIAGRVAFDTTGSNRITAAAVAVQTGQVEVLRPKVAGHFPKWKDSTLADAERVVELFVRECCAACAVTVNKDTDAWCKFWAAATPLQGAIVAQDRRPAGFVKPANVVTYWLFGYAFAVATAQAVKLGPSPRLLDYRGRQAIERTIICDSDIKGDENIEVFRSVWERHDASQPLMERLGLRFYTRGVHVLTEDHEPILLLADYLAGLTHTAFITDPGRISPPLPAAEAKRLLARLNESGKVVVHARDFDLEYGEIFGDAYRRSVNNAC